MHPIEEKIAKSFNFVKRDIEQLQRADLASDKTQTKMLDTIAAQDKLLKQQAVLVDDVKVRLSDREKAATKRKASVDKKTKSDHAQIIALKKTVIQTQKAANKATRDLERLIKKVEKLHAKPASKKKAVKKTSKKK